VNTSAPVFPALSRQVPPSVARLIRASTCTGAPPGAITVVSPMPTEPSGLRNAVPTTLAFWLAPHWSSIPSSV
jgi:hypothetical protein